MKQNEKKALLAKVRATRDGAKGLTNNLDALSAALTKTHDLELSAVASTITLLSAYVNQIATAAGDVAELIEGKQTED